MRDDFRRLISSRVLELDGVAGVGSPDDVLTVYLDSESDRVRAEVLNIVRSIEPSAEVEFLVTGRFQAHSAG